jgi:hypothetical protein
VAVRPTDRESVEQPRQRCRRHVPGCHRGGLRGAWHDGGWWTGLDARPPSGQRRFEFELTCRTPSHGQLRPDNDGCIFISVRGVRIGDNDNSFVNHHWDYFASGVERHVDNFSSGMEFANYDNHEFFVIHNNHESGDYYDDDETIDYYDDDKTIDRHDDNDAPTHDHDDEAAAHNDDDEAAAHNDDDEAAAHNDDDILHSDYLSVVLLGCEET